jgi:hypothetical protein
VVTCPVPSGVTVVHLQQADVEDIMESSARWKLEMIGYVANPLHDQEWHVLLGPQLVAPLDIEGRHRAVQEVQPDPVTDGEFHWPMLAVV